MLKLKDPSVFQPKIQRIGDQIALAYEPWDMRILADDYEDLEHRAISHVAMVWKLLVKSDEKHLTKRGRLIRETLLNDFEEIFA